MCKRWGAGASWQHDAKAHPHEARSLTLDIAKADTILGWRPLLSASQALELTVDWARDYIAGRDARDMTLGQIDHYETLLAAADE